MSAEPLWSPDAARIAAHRLTKFMHFVNTSRDMNMKTYDDVHRFSVREPEDFWSIPADRCITEVVCGDIQPRYLPAVGYARIPVKKRKTAAFMRPARDTTSTAPIAASACRPN